MDQLKPPESLNFEEGNVAENWERFYEDFDFYLQALDLQAAADARKVALLLTVAGREAKKVYKSFTYAPAHGEGAARVPAESPQDYELVVGKFREYCVPRRNLTYERYKFNTREQQEGETMDKFVTDLRTKAASCEYQQLHDELIKDRIVVAIREVKLKEKLLRIPDLTLERAIEVCKASEITQIQLKTVHGAEVQAVGAVNRHGPQRTQARRGGPRGEGASASASISDKQPPASAGEKEYFCRRCGSKHKFRQCPAYGNTCSRCGFRGHYDKRCRTREVDCIDVNNSDANENQDPDPEFFIGLVNTESEKKVLQVKLSQHCKWVHMLKVGQSIIPVKLDTGAGADLLSEKDYWSLKPRPALSPVNIKLTDYNSQEIKVNEIKEKIQNVRFVVVNNGPSILGSSTCERLNLVKRIMSVEEEELVTDINICTVPETRKELSSIPFAYEIKLHAEAHPVIKPPRRVPMAIRESLKKGTGSHGRNGSDS